jgi:hypothetical protein
VIGYASANAHDLKEQKFFAALFSKKALACLKLLPAS